MSNKNYTTIERIIAKIDNDFNPDNSDWIPRVGAWALDAMSILKCTKTEIKRVNLPVKERIVYGANYMFDNHFKVYTINGCELRNGAKADASAVYTKGEVDNLLANLDQSEIKADIKTNADAIAVLVGEDTNKSIRTIAAEEINALIDAANNEDTITNINSIINYVNENAGDIAQLTASVADNTGKLAGIESTVVAYVDSKVASVKTPKGSDEIDVSLNGTISINQVNVNKLVQSDDEEFIIDGGHA